MPQFFQVPEDELSNDSAEADLARNDAADAALSKELHKRTKADLVQEVVVLKKRIEALEKVQNEMINGQKSLLIEILHEDRYGRMEHQRQWQALSNQISALSGQMACDRSLAETVARARTYLESVASASRS